MNQAKTDEFKQCLIDASCTENEVQEVMRAYEQNNIALMNKLLQNRRSKLLDAIHKNEQKINCLDYFIYSMQKEKETTR